MKVKVKILVTVNLRAQLLHPLAHACGVIKFCTTITFVESLCPNSLLLCLIMLKSDGRAIMLGCPTEKVEVHKTNPSQYFQLGPP